MKMRRHCTGFFERGCGDLCAVKQKSISEVGQWCRVRRIVVQLSFPFIPKVLRSGCRAGHMRTYTPTLENHVFTVHRCTVVLEQFGPLSSIEGTLYCYSTQRHPRQSRASKFVATVWGRLTRGRDDPVSTNLRSYSVFIFLPWIIVNIFEMNAQDSSVNSCFRHVHGNYCHAYSAVISASHNRMVAIPHHQWVSVWLKGDEDSDPKALRRPYFGSV